MATEESTAETVNGAAAKDEGQAKPAEEPRGFGEHSRGLASEYAHEQGWGLNEEERSRQPEQMQNIDGGNDYEYGAQDLGDEPVNTGLDPQAGGPIQNSRATTEDKKG